MKPLRIAVRIKNNLLLERRERLQFTAKEMARNIGIPYTTYLQYEGMTQNPYNKKGEWRGPARKIAEYFLVTPDYLFPEAVTRMEKIKGELKVNVDEVAAFLYETQKTMQALPDNIVEQHELELDSRRCLECLDCRSRYIVELRCGFNPCGSHTYGEIGARLGISKGRVQQIETAALRSLRHSSISCLLKPHLDDNTW